MSNSISKTILNLFVTFFKIGAFTFGGGWVMIAMMEKDIVDKRKNRSNNKKIRRRKNHQ